MLYLTCFLAAVRLIVFCVSSSWCLGWSMICATSWSYTLVYTQFCVMHDIIRTHHECEDGIEKSVVRITDWHHEACRVMANIDHEGRIFQSLMYSFSCSPLNISCYIGRHAKDFQIKPRSHCSGLTCRFIPV